MSPIPYVDQVRSIVLAHTKALPVAVDVAIAPHGAVPPALFADLSEALEESPVPYRVDVVNLAETSAEFRFRVLAQGTKWQG